MFRRNEKHWRALALHLYGTTPAELAVNTHTHTSLYFHLNEGPNYCIAMLPEPSELDTSAQTEIKPNYNLNKYFQTAFQGWEDLPDLSSNSNNDLILLVKYFSWVLAV